MSELIALIALTSLLIGGALGWYLRPTNTRRPPHSDALTRTDGGRHPARSLPGRTRQTMTPHGPASRAATTPHGPASRAVRMTDQDAQWRRLLN
jgi:hypothetical protein